LFPTPAALAEAEIEAIGVTGRRADTIRSLSRAVADGVIPLDPGADHAAVRERLLGIAGIGEWTVGYALLRAFKDPDAFPAGDVALLRAAQRLGIAETAKALTRAAEDWRPWRAYMVMHLWRAGSGGG
jgi:AraC family transcriptional regulator of adaptative response / DNA-3-methyladenine glycosylase II